MTRSLALSTLLLLLGAGLLPGSLYGQTLPRSGESDLTGTYRLTLTSDGEELPVTIEIQRQEDQLAGTIVPPGDPPIPLSSIVQEEGRITITFETQHGTGRITATVQDDTFEGRVQIGERHGSLQGKRTR